MFATSERLCNPKPLNFTGSANNFLSASKHICSRSTKHQNTAFFLHFVRLINILLSCSKICLLSKLLRRQVYKLLKRGVFFQKWTWLIFGFRATMVEKWNFWNIIMLYTVWLQIFCRSKMWIEVIAKNEHLTSYKKKCYNYLEVWLQCNIINSLKGLEMCLSFGVLGVFVIFVIYVKRFWVLVKDKSCIPRVLFCMFIAYLTVF